MIDNELLKFYEVLLLENFCVNHESPHCHLSYLGISCALCEDRQQRRILLCKLYGYLPLILLPVVLVDHLLLSLFTWCFLRGNQKEAEEPAALFVLPKSFHSMVNRMSLFQCLLKLLCGSLTLKKKKKNKILEGH